ncbi:MAG: hypothetical protein ACKVYV_03915 [Limisphaerales bacterium]
MSYELHAQALLQYGGLVIYIALPGEAEEIAQRIAEEKRFSTSLSNRDTAPRGNEICLLSLRYGVLHSIWLGRFGVNAKSESARCRGTFFDYAGLDDLNWTDADCPAPLRDAFEIAYHERESRLDPADWQGALSWIQRKRPEAAAEIKELRTQQTEIGHTPSNAV